MSHAPCSPPDSNEQLEQWPDLLYTGTDTFAFNTAPVRDASMASAAFFITWVFLSYFCMNNMIAGVVAENFIQISEEQKGSALLTAEQRQWVRRSLQPMLPPSVPCAVRRTHAAAHAFARVAPADSAHASRAVSPLLLLLDLLLDPPPPPPAKVLTIERTAGVMPAVRYVPPSRWRRTCLRIVQSFQFDCLMLGAIVLCLASMATLHCVPSIEASACELSPEWQAFWLGSNVFTAAVFMAEFALKLTAFGPRRYFADSGNAFDFAVTLLTVVDLALEQHVKHGYTKAEVVQPGMLRALSLLRLGHSASGKPLSLVRQLVGMRRLLNTLIGSLPALLNVASLLLLIWFVYAVLGVHLFRDCPDGPFLNRHFNFRTLPNAYMLMFRYTTGEDFNGFMHETMAGSHFGASLIFHVSFTLIATLLMLDLCIAVVLDNFTAREEDSERLLPEAALEKFRDEWALLDPKGVGHAPSSELPALIGRCPKPLGLAASASGADADGRCDSSSSATRARQLAFLRELKIPDHQGLVNFQEVLQALTLHAQRQDELPRAGVLNAEQYERLSARISSRLMRARSKCNLGAMPPPRQTHAKAHAARLLQQTWRKRLGALVASAPAAAPADALRWRSHPVGRLRAALAARAGGGRSAGGGRP